MIGAGSLAPHLIKAHLTVRPSVKRVIVWNRSFEKAKTLVEKLNSEGRLEGIRLEASNDSLEEVVRLGDIVSCATSSETPLVKGAELKAGAHLDLVGSFQHSMRECDDILGDLVELIKGEKDIGRRDSEEITVFKSVGSAVVDLLTAKLVYETHINNQNSSLHG